MTIKNRAIEEFTQYFANECKQKKYMLRMYESINSKSYYKASDISNMQILKSRINEVDNMLNRINDPVEREMIKNLWIDKYSKAKVARIHNVSESEVYYAVNRACKKLYQSLD